MKHYTFLNAKEVSDLLSIKQKYLYSLVQERKIPHYRPNGKKLLFKECEILEFIERSKVEIINDNELSKISDKFNLKNAK